MILNENVTLASLEEGKPEGSFLLWIDKEGLLVKMAKSVEIISGMEPTNFDVYARNTTLRTDPDMRAKYGADKCDALADYNIATDVISRGYFVTRRIPVIAYKNGDIFRCGMSGDWEPIPAAGTFPNPGIFQSLSGSELYTIELSNFLRAIEYSVNTKDLRHVISRCYGVDTAFSTKFIYRDNLSKDVMEDIVIDAIYSDEKSYSVAHKSTVLKTFVESDEEVSVLAKRVSDRLRSYISENYPIEFGFWIEKLFITMLVKCSDEWKFTSDYNREAV